MANPARCNHWLLALLILPALGACKTASTAAPPAAATPAAPAPVTAPVGPQEPLAPAAGELSLRAPTVAGDSVAMSLVVAALPKVVADLDALSSRLGLPMPLGQSLVPALTAEPGPGGVVLSADLFARLDPAQPVSVVWLTPSAGAAAGWCAAITFKDAMQARQTLGQVGKVVSHSGAASQLRTPSGDTAWAGLKGRTLLVANREDVLLSGGTWAQAQQQGTLPGQVVFTLHPQVMAKLTGKPMDALVTGFVDEISTRMEDKAGSGKKLTPASRNMAKALIKLVARPVAELSAVRLIADVKLDRGLSLRAELEPLAKSAFAARTASPAPLALDRAMPVRGESVAVLAGGDMASSAQQWAEVIAASGPDGQTASKAFLTLMKDTVSRTACTVDLAATPLSSMCSMELRPGVNGAKALERYVAFVEASNAWGAEMEGRKPVAIKIKRSRGLIELETPVQNRDARAVLKTLFGGEVIKSAVTVKKGHLVQAIGRTPRDVLATYGKPSKVGPGPIVTAALAEAQGAESAGVVDVASLVMRLLGAGEDPMVRQAALSVSLIPGVSELRVPLALDVRGGSLLSVDLRAPLGSLENIAKVVRAFMGGMGAAAQ